jgi:hypothetical protein
MVDLYAAITMPPQFVLIYEQIRLLLKSVSVSKVFLMYGLLYTCNRKTSFPCDSATDKNPQSP